MAIEPDRFVSATQDRSDAGFDRALRPASLAEYIGQQAVKEQMSIFIEAAKKRREAAQRERHQACNAARRAEGKEELSFSEWEKDEKATREKLAKDRERASEAAR